jgi:hypothetical protein
MKSRFLLSAFAALALAGATASAQTAAAPQPGAAAIAVMNNTTLCDWFRNDDRLTWEAVTQKTTNDWQTAVSSIATDFKLSEADASRKLVQLCRARFTRTAEAGRN